MLYESENIIKLLDNFKAIKNEDICIISDFDDTLSKGILNNGKRGSNTFSVFANNYELLEQDYVEKTNELFKYYYAIEQDPKISDDEKGRTMIEWWEKEFDLYKKYGLVKETFTNIIENKLIELKYGTDIFFQELNKYEISTIIFSAGIYDLIHSFLEQNSMDYENVHVVANLFEFDLENRFVKTKGDIIHSQNKTFQELSHLPIYEELKNKKGCILLGDSTSDVKMVEGSNFDYILKIGFLNKLPQSEGYDERFNAHCEKFDIVLDGREDFTKINQIIKEVLE